MTIVRIDDRGVAIDGVMVRSFAPEGWQPELAYPNKTDLFMAVLQHKFAQEVRVYLQDGYQQAHGGAEPVLEYEELADGSVTRRAQGTVAK